MRILYIDVDSLRRPDLVEHALALLGQWHAEAMDRAPHQIDPLETVLREGGPPHVRQWMPRYLDRLRETGRGHWADLLEHTYRASSPVRKP
jgi:hypothetical protein